MDSLQPVINLLVLMSTLSIAAERLTNAMKLRTAHLAPHTTHRDWERQVGRQALMVSIAIAILLKADFFEIVSHLNAPWETLGWVQLSGADLVHSPALDSIPRVLYTLTGSVLSGVAMGFGSKFWHDVLDIVYGARARIRKVSGVRDQVSGRDTNS